MTLQERMAERRAKYKARLMFYHRGNKYKAVGYYSLTMGEVATKPPHDEMVALLVESLEYPKLGLLAIPGSVINMTVYENLPKVIHPQNLKSQ